MSIIIEKEGKKVYKTKGYMSYEDKKTADELDRFLEREVPRIEDKISQRGLLKFKGKPGAIKLWYNVGGELRRLWDRVKTTFNLPETYLPIFMKAVHDHSSKIKLGSGRSMRLKNAYFYYCYLIADFPWEMVETAGNWTAWVEFLDSKRIRNDPRIIEWFASRAITEPPGGVKCTKLKWFRKITRAIRKELREIDTTVLEKDELFRKLDLILKNIVNSSMLKK